MSPFKMLKLPNDKIKGTKAFAAIIAKCYVSCTCLLIPSRKLGLYAMAMSCLRVCQCKLVGHWSDWPSSTNVLVAGALLSQRGQCPTY